MDMDTEEHARYPLDDEDTTESPAAGMASDDASARGKKKVVWSLPTDGEDTDQQEKLEELEKSLSRALPEANRPIEEPSRGELRVPSRGVLRVSGTATPQIEIPNVDDGVADLDNKRRSATDAQYRASRLNEDVSRDSSPVRKKTGHRRRQSPFKALL